MQLAAGTTEQDATLRVERRRAASGPRTPEQRSSGRSRAGVRSQRPGRDLKPSSQTLVGEGPLRPKPVLEPPWPCVRGPKGGKRTRGVLPAASETPPANTTNNAGQARRRLRRRRPPFRARAVAGIAALPARPSRWAGFGNHRSAPAKGHRTWRTLRARGRTGSARAPVVELSAALPETGARNVQLRVPESSVPVWGPGAQPALFRPITRIRTESVA